MKDQTEKWKVEIRQDLQEKIAAGLAQDGGTEQCFRESQNLDGYKLAFNSWGDALWWWVDSDLTPEIENAWRQILLAHKNEFSPAGDYSKPASLGDMEHYLQSFLMRRAFFLGGLRHKKQTDREWFKSFGFYFYVASLLGDNGWFDEVARLTLRKTSQKQLGKRSLHFWLLMQWIPACFWAITNDGIAARLIFGDTKRRYNERSIRNEISKMKLWRPAKPLYWGIGKDGCWRLL